MSDLALFLKIKWDHFGVSNKKKVRNYVEADQCQNSSKHRCRLYSIYVCSLGWPKQLFNENDRDLLGGGANFLKKRSTGKMWVQYLIKAEVENDSMSPWDCLESHWMEVTMTHFGDKNGEQIINYMYGRSKSYLYIWSNMLHWGVLHSLNSIF